MPTIMIIMWIVSTLIMFCISTYFWIKRDKTSFEITGVIFLVCAVLGFIAGWLLLIVIIYFALMERFEKKEE